MAFVYVVVALLVLVGLVGSAVPVIPGTPLILLAAGIYAVATDFDPVGPGRLLVLAGLALLAAGLDYLAGAVGVRKLGGTRWGVAGAVLGALAGVFFGPLGLLLGPLAGAMAGELLRDRDLRRSLLSGLGSFLGLLLGAVAKLGIAVVMTALFLWWALRGG